MSANVLHGHAAGEIPAGKLLQLSENSPRDLHLHPLFPALKRPQGQQPPVPGNLQSIPGKGEAQKLAFLQGAGGVLRHRDKRGVCGAHADGTVSPGDSQPLHAPVRGVPGSLIAVGPLAVLLPRGQLLYAKPAGRGSYCRHAPQKQSRQQSGHTGENPTLFHSSPPFRPASKHPGHLLYTVSYNTGRRLSMAARSPRIEKKEIVSPAILCYTRGNKAAGPNFPAGILC